MIGRVWSSNLPKCDSVGSTWSSFILCSTKNRNGRPFLRGDQFGHGECNENIISERKVTRQWNEIQQRESKWKLITRWRKVSERCGNPTMTPFIIKVFIHRNDRKGRYICDITGNRQTELENLFFLRLLQTKVIRFSNRNEKFLLKHNWNTRGVSFWRTETERVLGCFKTFNRRVTLMRKRIKETTSTRGSCKVKSIEKCISVCRFYKSLLYSLAIIKMFPIISKYKD